MNGCRLGQRNTALAPARTHCPREEVIFSGHNGPVYIATKYDKRLKSRAVELAAWWASAVRELAGNCDGDANVLALLVAPGTTRTKSQDMASWHTTGIFLQKPCAPFSSSGMKWNGSGLLLPVTPSPRGKQKGRTDFAQARTSSSVLCCLLSNPRHADGAPPDPTCVPRTATKKRSLPATGGTTDEPIIVTRQL